MADEPEPTTPEPDHKPPEDKDGKKGSKSLEGKIGGIPKKYLLIAAVAGVGIGLYLRNKNKAKTTTTATVTPLPAPTAATDTGTGSSPGGGGFISYPSFVTGGDLSPQPSPAPIASPQAPQTFGGSTPAASTSVTPTAADHGISTQVTGPVVPLGSSPQSAVAAGITPAYVPPGGSVAPIAPSPTQQPNYSGQLYTTPVTPDQQVSYPFIYG